MIRVLLLGCLLSALICVQGWKPDGGGVSCCISKADPCPHLPPCPGPACKYFSCPGVPEAKCVHQFCGCGAVFYIEKYDHVEVLTPDDCKPKPTPGMENDEIPPNEGGGPAEGGGGRDM